MVFGAQSVGPRTSVGACEGFGGGIPTSRVYLVSCGKNAFLKRPYDLRGGLGTSQGWYPTQRRRRHHVGQFGKNGARCAGTMTTVGAAQVGEGPTPPIASRQGIAGARPAVHDRERQAHAKSVRASMCVSSHVSRRINRGCLAGFYAVARKVHEKTRGLSRLQGLRRAETGPFSINNVNQLWPVPRVIHSLVRFMHVISLLYIRYIITGFGYTVTYTLRYLKLWYTHLSTGMGPAQE